MFVVGLTGGIGSGKSAAAKLFSELGVSIVNADQIARDIVEPGSAALDAITEHFGSDILLDDGALDRAQLRQKIFANPNERQWLEQLTHPLIGTAIFDFLNAKRNDNEAPYRILESPLLMETSQQQLAQRLLLIDVPEAVQIARTMARDNNTEEQVRAIIEAHMSREETRSRADDIIENTGTLDHLHQRVSALHEKYCQLAQSYQP
jgi:dephospho-CoA kinase